MRRILVTFCIVFPFALGNEYGDYDLRQPDYGQARRDEVDLETFNSGQENDRVGNLLDDREISVSAEGDRNAESKEPSVTAEDNENVGSKEPSMTAEDNEYEGSKEPSVTAEDNGNARSKEPSVTAEDNRDQNDFRLDDMKGKLDEKRYRVELAAGDPTEFRTNNEHYYKPHFYKNLGRRFVPVYPYKEVKEKLKKAKNMEDADLIPRWAPPEVVLAVMKKAIKNRPASKPSDDEEFTRPNILRSGDYWDGVWKEEVKPENILRTNQNNGHWQTREKLKQAKNLEDADLIPRWAPPEVVLAVMKKAIKNRPASKPSDDEEFTRPNILRSGDYWDGVWKEEVNPDNILRTNQNNGHRQSRNEEELNSLPITAKLVPGTKLYDLISGVVRHSPRLVYIINEE